MRWLTVLAVLSGVIVALAYPQSGRAGTGYWYQAAMAPSSQPDGYSPLLNCGWHTGACDSQYEDGPALDWASDPGVDCGAYYCFVYFRGWFSRSNSPLEWNRLTGHPFQFQSGPLRCDEMVTDVYENYSHKVRFGMHYLHTLIYLYDDFFILTQAANGGVFNSPIVGYMSYDTGCQWEGYHVHDFAAYVAVNSTARNWPYIPNGDYCLYDNNPSDCRAYQNNANWARWTNWEEGS